MEISNLSGLLVILWIFYGSSSAQNIPSDASCPDRPLGCDTYCEFGYKWGFNGQCVCSCYQDPCANKRCSTGEVCIVQHQGGRFWGGCIGSIDHCPPDVEVFNCFVSPCLLNPCYRNDSLICIPDYCGGCFAHFFTKTGDDVTKDCRAQSYALGPAKKPGICPKLSGGFCFEECDTDSDCLAERKCCSNGCGHVCVSPVLEKSGTCPRRDAFTNKNCQNECNSDSQCSSDKKCCNNGCAQVCTAPFKSTACASLREHVFTLPSGTLFDGYIPQCENDGSYKQIQCDQQFCWCVKADGKEVFGTKMLVTAGRTPNCRAPRNCFITRCTNNCVYGYKTDVLGCPLATCDCRDICQGINCGNNYETCQMVEPACNTQGETCLAVPKCLVNPCRNGNPMTLPETGVTGLCTESSQCSINHWCHLVGYNGFGFCCQKPANSIRPGKCPSIAPGSGGTCSGECKVDTDCRESQKCCFNGCGFSCANIGSGPQTPDIKRPSPKIGECPRQTAIVTLEGRICRAECQNDQDCTSFRKCCTDGCGSQCVFPSKTSACIHSSITAEVLLGNADAVCDSKGQFEKIQCQNDISGIQICRCVNVNNGKEVPGTRIRGRRPDCTFAPSICSQISCSRTCPFGYRLDHRGCSICQCSNPCTDGRLCKPGEICVMTEVECFDKGACPPQPRCIINACPSGLPFKDVTSGRLFQCAPGVVCPTGYWCHNIGVNERGLCCPLPAKRTNPGQCPGKEPMLGASDNSCTLDCTSDERCGSKEKCCYNGCGVKCTKVVDGSVLITSSPNKPGRCPIHVQSNTDLSQNCITQCRLDSDCPDLHKCCNVGCSQVCAPPIDGENVLPTLAPTQAPFSVDEDNKLGTCPTVPADFLRTLCVTDIAECSTDRHCTGLKKCCSNGCTRRCVYPDRTTACRHLQGALEQISTVSYSPQCSSDGGFIEIQCDRGRGLCWCVESTGKEKPGTRTLTSRGQPNCRAPRRCPQLNCDVRNCRYGFELNFEGCPTCNCYNPCQLIRCSHPFQMCVLEQVPCITGVCPPVPRCVVNACPVGRALVDTTAFTLVTCNENSGCPLARSFCHHYKGDGGYCCPSPEPTRSPGSCPLLPPNVVGSCKVECTTDKQCITKSASKSKCCFNGCGMSCVTPAVSLKPGRDSKLGECLKEARRVCTGSHLDECSKDSECPGIQKCCSDGCARKCFYAHRTTSCLHQKAAAELLKGRDALLTFKYVPKCDELGDFDQIQSYGNIQWCVDVEGMEIPGTRISGQRPNCDRIRSCPSLFCGINCPMGYKIGLNGCEECACFDPCQLIRCPFSYQVCRLVTVDCSLPPKVAVGCAPVPKCVPNACQTGEPLKDPDSSELSLCDPANTKSCPTGHFCRQAGFEGNQGYCCPGPIPMVPLSSCPAIATYAKLIDRNLCKEECKVDSQCTHGSACCYNGCGMSCITQLSLTTDVDRKVETKVGVCPVNPLSNPGCRSDCNRDRDCPGFQKCCPYGCGRICQLPHTATPCIHWQAALKDLGEPGVDCDINGHFNPVQCSPTLGQCWCVDKTSGIEKPGTRATGRRPNCDSPNFCAVRCTLQCQHGLRLDRTGCPLNGRCQCRDPCQEISCPKTGHVCVTDKVSCLNNKPCPPIPKCRLNPCGTEKPQIDLNSGLMLTCSGLFSNECDSVHQCKLFVGTTTMGLCCPRGQTTIQNAIKIGDCPSKAPKELSTRGCVKECNSDNDCSASNKCCTFGCARACVAPFNSTNCIQYQSAVDNIFKRLQNPAVNPLYRPLCDSQSGMFSSVQCDSRSAMCWCVDTVTGVEIHGTRARQERPNCNSARSCPVSCDGRSVRCAFGYKMNDQGCPEDANCPCKNPCYDIKCPTGEVCLMREVPCREQSCLPVPSCEINPCRKGTNPASEPQTHRLFTCLKNSTRICPGGYFCTGYDQLDTGICCLGQAPTHNLGPASGSGSVAITCKHGDPFSLGVDGYPLQCTKSQDVCPSTHYCLTKDSKPGRGGICCIRASYACSLRSDAGPCKASNARFFYQSSSKSCQKFKYGGCRGNLNNFGSEQECLRFCSGSDPNHERKANDDPGNGIDRVQMGFNLTGPSLRDTPKSPLESAFISYLSSYGPKRSEIRDLQMRNDNSVQFAIESDHAGDYSRRISDAVSEDRFVFQYQNLQYRAQPRTWYSKLQKKRQDSPNSAFIGLLVSCVILGAVIILALCTTAICLYRKNKKREGSYGTNSSSPTHYINGALINGSEISRPMIDPATGSAYNTRSLPRKVFSTDDIDSVKENSGYYSQAQYIWQNGRRAPANEQRSDNQLYY